MREAGPGSLTLTKLAEEGQAVVEIPRQVALLSAAELDRRLAYAVGARPPATELARGSLAGMAVGVLIAMAGQGALGGTVFTIAAIVALVAWAELGGARQRNAKQVKVALAEVAALPFPTHELQSWLAADVPMLDVVLARPVDAATFRDAVRAIGPAIGVERLRDRRFRLTLPPRQHVNATGTRVTRCGDLALWRTLVDRMLRPLHEELGIEAVHFGGTVAELPLALAAAAAPAAPKALPSGDV